MAVFKATVHLKNVSVEVVAETEKELFKARAKVHEIHGERACGLCKKENIIPVHRTASQGQRKFDYFEYRCLDCGAVLTMGQLNEGGGLFIKRKLDANGKPDQENGKRGDHNGWTHYRGENETLEPQQPQQQQSASKWPTGDEQPAQPIGKPVEPPPPKPPTIPTTYGDLFGLFQAKQAELVRLGKLKPNELLDYLDKNLKGLPQNPSTWTAEHCERVYKIAKNFLLSRTS